jgi:membrane-anchored protein YejM (alkaline phosphatase superfamily)
MYQRNFALVWGRKMFFGLVWPLLMIVGLSYFQTQIFPKNFIELMFVVLSYVGFYGAMTSVLYFVFYAPFAYLFPTYYLTRFWSLLITLVACLLIFFDSILYASYGMHFNKFFLDLILNGAAKEIYQIQQSVMIISASIVISIAFYFWFQGERHWRHMQRKFKNTNSNWYFLLIALSLGGSLIISHFGSGVTTARVAGIAQSFFVPFSFNFENKNKEGLSVFSFYAQEGLECKGEENQNIVFILVNDWKATRLNENEYPYLSHLVFHGTQLNNHKVLGTGIESGLFSILYGLPSLYEEQMISYKVRPAFIKELERRNYGLYSSLNKSLRDSKLGKIVFSFDGRDFNGGDNFNSVNFERPFFFLFSLDYKSPKELEESVKLILDEIAARELSDETTVVVTGTNSNSSETQFVRPLILLNRKFKNRQANIESTQVDIVPTLMTELFRCEKSYPFYSDGQSIFDFSPRDYLVGGDKNEFFILDEMKQQILKVSSGEGLEVRKFGGQVLPESEARIDLALDVLKRRLRFSKGL